MKFSSRILATLALLLMLTFVASCTEEMDSGSTSSTASTPPPDQPPQSQTVVQGQSALGGAMRAAQGTRDKVADYQQKLIKDMEDN